MILKVADWPKGITRSKGNRHHLKGESFCKIEMKSSGQDTFGYLP